MTHSLKNPNGKTNCFIGENIKKLWWPGCIRVYPLLTITLLELFLDQNICLLSLAKIQEIMIYIVCIRFPLTLVLEFGQAIIKCYFHPLMASCGCFWWMLGFTVVHRNENPRIFSLISESFWSKLFIFSSVLTNPLVGLHNIS